MTKAGDSLSSELRRPTRAAEPPMPPSPVPPRRGFLFSLDAAAEIGPNRRFRSKADVHERAALPASIANDPQQSLKTIRATKPSGRPQFLRRRAINREPWVPHTPRHSFVQNRSADKYLLLG